MTVTLGSKSMQPIIIKVGLMFMLQMYIYIYIYMHSIVYIVYCWLRLLFSVSSKSRCPGGQRRLRSMASGQGALLEVGALGGSTLAKPLYLQRLERALKLDSFLRQTSTIFNKDIPRSTKVVEQLSTTSLASAVWH